MGRGHKCDVASCDNEAWARRVCRKHYYRLRANGDPELCLKAMPPRGAVSAFIASLSLAESGCVRWPFGDNGAGYGMITLNGKRSLVTRYLCEKFYGPPPTPKHVAAHDCGNGHLRCVTPRHLRWKTQAENREDSRLHGTLSQGEHHAAKLTSRDVLEIVELAKTRSQALVGEQFNVSQTMISRIIRGKSWASVTGINRKMEKT